MNIFTRLLLLKKEIKVTSIPNELLKFKSRKSELENVTFYYLDNGNKLLSILDESNKKVLEVIRILNSLDEYFHFHFDNLFISKTEEKVIGFSYPLEYEKSNFKNKCYDLKLLVEILYDENDPENLKEYLLEKDLYKDKSARSVLANTMFLYKVLKYLNKKNISVKDLEFDDIKGYQQSYQNKYIQLQNAIRKLDILDASSIKDEEIEIINLCIEYFKDASVLNVYNFSFNDFIEKFTKNYKKLKSGTGNDDTFIFFENINFLKIFYEQFENITVFECEHEYDKTFLRCPQCGGLYGVYPVRKCPDKILSKKEYNLIFDSSNLKLKNDNLEVYSYTTRRDIYLLFNENLLTEEKKKCILKYVQSQNNAIEAYLLLYNLRHEFIGLNINSNLYYEEIIVEDINKYINFLFSKFTFNTKNTFYEHLIGFIHSCINELKELYESGLALDIADNTDYKQLMDCFMILKLKKHDEIIDAIDVKPSSLKLLEKDKEYDLEEIIANQICIILFNLCKNKFNSRIENDKLVSDRFDTINLLNLQIISEYKKFLNNEEYDAKLVLKILEKSKGVFEYDETYVASPLKFKSVLDKDIDKKELKAECEFVKRKINNVQNLHWLYDNKEKLNPILPEYIVYAIEEDQVVYKGYWIKKTSTFYVLDVFKNQNLQSVDNKDVMKMLLTYYKMLSSNNHINDVFVEFLCYDMTFSDMFICYRAGKQSKNSSKEYFYNELLTTLKNSNFYLSDMISIIENSNFLFGNIKKLNKIYESFTNYCEVHKCWYENTLTRCSICSIYYEYVNFDKIVKTKQKEYENKFYSLLSYKSNVQLKLYKYSDNLTLANGKKIENIENEVLLLLKNKIKIKNSQKILKLVKDSATGNVIGILISKFEGSKSVYDILESYISTNLTYLKVAWALVNDFADINYVFENLEIKNNYSITSFFKYHLFYSEKENKIFINDCEIIENCNLSNNRITSVSLRNLDKILKEILSYNDMCYDFRSIAFPKIDNDYINNIREILENLIEYYREETVKLCSIHQVLYNNIDGMCPLCAEEMEDYWIFKKEERGRQINVGGEALIYTLGLSNLVKTYTKGNLNKNQIDGNVDEWRKMLDEHFEKKMKERENVLSVMKKLYVATKNDLATKNFIIVFPKKIFYGFKNKTFFGFVQDKVVDAVSVSLFTNKTKCKELGFTTIESLLEVLIGYGEGIEYLHNSPEIRKIVPEGVVLGDVSGRNALYSKYHKKVAIIDMDSVGIKDYPCYTYTEDYIDPLILKKTYPDNHLTFESDWYSYAIICFYILTKVHPFEGNYIDKNNQRMGIAKRKENKISVVGKYKDEIILPTVVDSWDWMHEELLNAFIDIFENEKRFSILNLLKKAYNQISGKEKYKIDKISDISECDQYNLRRELQENINYEENKSAVENEKNNKSQVEVLLSVLPNLDLKKNSQNLIIQGNKIYYKTVEEKSLLCDEKLRFSKKFTFGDSENKLSETFENINIDECFVRDNNGIATIIEDGKKMISFIDGTNLNMIYRMSNPDREFKILYDQLNNKYLLISLDNSKSYIILEGNKIINYSDIYNVCISDLPIFYDDDFEFKVAYIGNAIYYSKEGSIARIDLITGEEKEILCSYSLENSSIRVFSDAIIIVNEEGIFKIK